MSGARRHHSDDGLDPVRAALRSDAAGVAVALLGEPSKAHSTKRTLRWGGKGALAVEISGPKKGLWYTHAGTEGSDLFGLIRHAHGCSFPDAVTWARNWTGIGEANDAEPVQPRPRPQPAPDPAAEAEAAADVAKRIGVAQQIAGACRPLEGTLGAYYAMQVRGIPRPAAGWPASILWSPNHRALVAVATTADGTVQAVQRVHLDHEGGKITPGEMARRKLPAVKVTNGVSDGAVVRLPGDKAGPLLVAEGPETGLAAWSATGHETWITLGGMGKVDLPTGRRVVACADDDPPAHDPKHGTATKALNKALARWRAAGIHLVVARPWASRRRDKSDMADVILASGADAVRARIGVALGADAAALPTRVPVGKARELVAEPVRAFFAPIEAHSIALCRAEDAKKAGVARAKAEAAGKAPDMAMEAQDDLGPVLIAPLAPYTHGIKVDVGVGKTHSAHQEAAHTLAGMRARGDNRAMAMPIPRHVLAEEQAAAFEALPEAQEAGLKAATWRGREAVDPATRSPTGTGPTMCSDIDRVKDAESAGVSIQQAVCSGRVRGADGKTKKVQCPLFSTCAYQAQRKVKADLWFGSHELLFQAKPEAMGELAAVIVDEAAYRKGTIGAEGRHLTLPLDVLRSEPVVRHKSGMIDRGGCERLGYLRRRLVDVLDRQDDGPVQRTPLLASLVTADGAFEAHGLEHARRVRLLHPGQPKEARKEAVKQSAENATVSRCARVWDALRVQLSAGGPERSGWLELATEETQHGPVRVLRIKGLAEVSDGWKVPTLLLDALLPINLVRFFWPDAKLVADVRAATPHQHIHQVVDRAYAKNMLEQLEEEAGARTAEGKRRANRLRDLRDLLVREARRHAPGQVLVVVQQAVERALLTLAPLPGNIELAHHNNVAGMDRWRDVAALIVVGRTQPPVSAVERLTEALTGRAMDAPVAWYDRADAVREMADGSTVPAEADRHPDPIAEAIRWQIAEGELVQIIGRGRGVNRTADNPLHVLVLTDLPLPMPLAGTLNAADLDVTPEDRMMAAGGVAFENARHAATAYPELWASHTAARLATWKERSVSNPYKESHIGKGNTPLAVSYRLQGAGQKQVVALADPLLCPDPLAFLTAKLGRLAFAALNGVPVAVPMWEVLIGEPQPDQGEAEEVKAAPVHERKAAEREPAAAGPLPTTGNDPVSDDDPDPPPPPAGHPAADPGWGEYDTWAGGGGWEPVDSSGGWPGVDSSGADVAEPHDQRARPRVRSDAKMQVQPDVQASAWRGAEPGPPGYHRRL